MLGPDSPTGLITVSNRGTDDALIQLSVVQWTQTPTDDVLAPTRDVLGNPAIFLLKGGEQQVARFALRVAPDLKERSYRISVQEVPRQNIPNSVMTVLRLLVPIFVAPPNPTAALDWTVQRAADGYVVTMHNSGNVHVQIKTLTVTGAQGAPAQRQVSLYILPGSSRTLRLPAEKPDRIGATVKIGAETDQGSMSASVGVGVGTAEGAAGHS
jgi:fimbrial chaperone protein